MSIEILSKYCPLAYIETDKNRILILGNEEVNISSENILSTKRIDNVTESMSGGVIYGAELPPVDILITSPDAPLPAWFGENNSVMYIIGYKVFWLTKSNYNSMIKRPYKDRFYLNQDMTMNWLDYFTDKCPDNRNEYLLGVYSICGRDWHICKMREECFFPITGKVLKKLVSPCGRYLLEDVNFKCMFGSYSELLECSEQTKLLVNATFAIV